MNGAHTSVNINGGIPQNDAGASMKVIYPTKRPGSSSRAFRRPASHVDVSIQVSIKTRLGYNISNKISCAPNED